ncbi:MAG: divalent metal cation transporter [Candidatus Magasanikbacteria bacterium]|nr:divalent metal cation transporter [Candidatus Magasanikbacteria bacterium]
MGKLKHWGARILLILSVIGPGIITANADNDAGGISTYSIVGAHYGYSLLWVLFLITFSLGITQEFGMRLGIVTGKGLAALIREKFGVKLTVFAMLTMLVANIGTITAEFSGVAASFSLIGVSKYLAVPFFALIVWFILYKGTFKKAEKIFLLLSSFYIVYIIAGFMVKPDFGAATTALVTPSFRFDIKYLIAFIALIGTTITPWGQFFVQSYVVDKGVRSKHLNISRFEAYFGAIITNLVSFFIIVTTANVLFKYGLTITSASDAALALRPLVGQFAQFLFAFGLFSASMLGALILPVATAYAICEAFGWESGFNLNWSRGRIFYSLIILSIVIPSAIVLLPGVNLMFLMLMSQAINGMLLPIILIYLMRLMNDKELLGKHVNCVIVNTVAGITAVGLIAASIILIVVSFFPQLTI